MTQSSTPPIHALSSILNSAQILQDPATLTPYAIDNLLPQAAALPATAQQAAEVIRFAAKENLAVIPTGARTKLRQGPTPTRYDIALDLSALNKIAHYDPADLTVSVDACMPIEKLNAALQEKNQFLPLLVPYYSQSTIAGAIASGLDSPLRQAYGTARDFLLGAEFIDGTGAQVKSGGRVVKNVTGYDLHKLLIGSLGTLGIITRLNFRTFPIPQSTRGFVASFLTHEAALAARRKIIDSPLTPLTLDIINPATAKIFASRSPSTPEPAIFSKQAHSAENKDTSHQSLPLPGEWFHPNEYQLCVAFSGSTEVIARYTRDLTQSAQQSNATSLSILDDTNRPSVWGRLREALPLFRESSPDATIFKFSLLPAHQAQAIAIFQSVSQAANLNLALIARASGTVYIAALPASASASASGAQAEKSAGHFSQSVVQMSHEILTLARTFNARASLLFAPSNLKPQLQSTLASCPRSDQSLMRKLKSAFDPQNILSPGRQ
jgi:FAD/FMN-containing dehydrogenase